ncbi:hypothetical protein CARUB_v10028601mg, partial [Capsella rubella]
WMGSVKKPKLCDKVSHGADRISNLPEPLMLEILARLPTKYAVRTTTLSSKWRKIWPSLPELDLSTLDFKNLEAFVSFVERFFNSNMESIGKLKLVIYDPYDKIKATATRWIDVVTSRRNIQHIEFVYNTNYLRNDKIPVQSIYTCETLVHLKLCGVSLFNAEVVSLPCLRVIHLESAEYRNESTLEKLISVSPVLEDLTVISTFNENRFHENVLQVRSQTVKRIHMGHIRVVIDAPLLQHLIIDTGSEKHFEVINLGLSTKLHIYDDVGNEVYNYVFIHDILTDIAKNLLRYSNLGPVLQFRNLCHLNARFPISDLEMLPTILESCPKLESFTLELVKNRYTRGEKKKDPKVMFSTVPQCLVTSLKFVELRRGITRYEGEIELIRYLLKNSKILEKLRLDVYYTQKTKYDFLKEVVAIPRCSNACEVLVL